LTAAAGTPIRIRENHDSESGGSSSSLTELRVLNGGKIGFAGSAGNLVTLASAATSPSAGQWYGVNVLSGGKTDVAYCDIADAQYGVSADDPDASTFKIRQSALHDNSYHGIKARAEASTFEVDSCSVYNNGYSGIYLQKKKTLTSSPVVTSYLTGNSV